MFCCVPGFAFGRCVSFKHFWPLTLIGCAPIAIILQALCRLGGAALFRSSRPSSSWGFPFWRLGLTVRRSRPPTAAAELRALVPSPALCAQPPVPALRPVPKAFKPFGPPALVQQGHQLSFLQRCAAFVAQRFFVGRALLQGKAFPFGLRV